MCIAAGTAALIGGGIAGAGAIGGSLIQADAQGQAADTQAGMFNTINQQEQPFIQAGYGATQSLSDMLKPGGYLTQQFNPTQAQLNAYPGYQFALQQGDRALQNSMTPGSGALSGATLKSLMGFNQNLANTNYGNYFNQFQTQQNNIFNRLSGLAGLGQNAASQVGNNGATLGTGIAQAQAAAGGSLGAGISGGLGQLGQGALLSSVLSGGNYGGGASSLFPAGSLDYGLPTSGFASYSDRRLKTGIKPLRQIGNLMAYSFRYLWSNRLQTGYMADEVRRHYPDAVSTDPHGFLMVDYSKLEPANG